MFCAPARKGRGREIPLKKKEMRALILIGALLLANGLQGQQILRGKVLDGKNGKGLAYVNIGIAGAGIGTVSQADGHFELLIPDTFAHDSLKFSMVGYSPRTLYLEDMLKMDESQEIGMQPKVTQLEEVLISPRNWKERILGNRTQSRKIIAGFTSNELGNEVGIRVHIRSSPTLIDAFNVSIAANHYDTLRFRINFYDLKDGMPHKRIQRKDIIVETTMQDGLLSIDLRNYDIVVYDDFFVSLEWIEDLGEEDGLYFSAGFLGSPIISRKTSQAEWEKLSGVSLGFNVTVRY